MELKKRVGHIIYSDCGDHWEALFNGGWFVARGPTRKDAHDSLIKRINAELKHIGANEIERIQEDE